MSEITTLHCDACGLPIGPKQPEAKPPAGDLTFDFIAQFYSQHQMGSIRNGRLEPIYHGLLRADLHLHPECRGLLEDVLRKTTDVLRARALADVEKLRAAFEQGGK